MQPNGSILHPVKDDNAIVLYVTWEISVPAPAFTHIMDTEGNKIELWVPVD